MNSKRNIVYLIVPVVIVMLIYNIWFFALIGLYIPNQWIVYAFTMFAFIMQIVISFWLKDINETNAYVSSTTYIIGIVYIVIQIILGRVFMFIPNGKIICTIELIICSSFLILLFGMGMAKNVIRQTEKNDENKISFVKNMNIRIMRLKLQNENSEIVKELDKLEDALNYSDPVSNHQLEEMELEFESLVQKIEIAVKTNSNEIYGLISQALKVLEERNDLCKLTK